MKKNSQAKGNPEQLRKGAEERLRNRPPESQGTGASFSSERVLHELQVHQIELEMQNEELRESRSELESLLDKYTDLYDFAPVAYFTLAATGAINSVNLPGASLLGVERVSLTKRNFGGFVARESRPVFESWLKRVFSTETKQHCLVVLEREGLSLSVELDASISSDGEEGRVVAVDVTGRIALEEQLRQSQKVEIVGQLAGGVAHDFNNITAAMILNLELLQLKVVLPPEAKAPLGILNELATRAATLTRQLLLFSRRQAMTPVLLDVNAAVSDLFEMLQRIPGEEISFILELSPEDLWVKADAAMFDQALLNLCLNAREAMPRGGTLTLSTGKREFDREDVGVHPEPHPGKFSRIRVSDTGCGMSPDVMKRIFEPFFTTKDIGKGTGLGLTSSQGIVEQHNGWLSVESVLREGSHFDLYFPWLPKPEENTTPLAVEPVSERRKRTILLVEDEAPLLAIYKEALSMIGWKVLAASNGEDGFKTWEENKDRIEVLLTDMRLPKGKSGLDLAKSIWERNPSVKVIIMSGYSQEIAQETRAGTAAYTFLPKPFDLSTLSKTVRECLP
jgi:two-component system cell cycle sensor histidine kinase/response regulator CckA